LSLGPMALSMTPMPKRPGAPPVQS
jgi:hypothetical protein